MPYGFDLIRLILNLLVIKDWRLDEGFAHIFNHVPLNAVLHSVIHKSLLDKNTKIS